MDFGIFISIFIFLFGLAIGSFLNVLIDRLPRDETISGRSHCDHCKKQLEWYDLVPVFSFLILRGECRYCHRRISLQNPLVESVTGILFVFIVRSFGFGSLGFDWSLVIVVWNFFKIAYLLFIVSALIVIFVSDLKTYIIPDKIIYPAIGIALFYNLIFNFQTGNFFLAIAAVLLAAGFFFMLFIVSKGAWIGFGDVKLGILMGLALGWPNILIALFLAYLFGAIMGVGLILTGKKGLKSEMPFGPFLVLGMFIAMFWGGEIIKGYLNLFII